jgi:hypothetical protein
MNDSHLSMEQLVALRDNDRSEPWLADAQGHLTNCPACAGELDRLHQRTARLKTLATLTPAKNQFPAIRTQLAYERRALWQRRTAWLGAAAAAMVAFGVIATDLIKPTPLDASEQLETAMNRSQVLELTLNEWRPEDRTLDGRSAQVIMQLEDRIADIDARLQRNARLDKNGLERQLALWQERVGLMSALVDVHLTRASNVDL